MLFSSTLKIQLALYKERAIAGLKRLIESVNKENLSQDNCLIGDSEGSGPSTCILNLQ